MPIQIILFFFRDLTGYLLSKKMYVRSDKINMPIFVSAWFRMTTIIQLSRIQRSFHSWWPKNGHYFVARQTIDCWLMLNDRKLLRIPISIIISDNLHENNWWHDHGQNQPILLKCTGTWWIHRFNSSTIVSKHFLKTWHFRQFEWWNQFAESNHVCCLYS